nr:MAG TPA: hypothetical protein [Caudoviricetes sp.]DAI51007.1 MAG TPA: hypothetical protein [Caudoviricetes sp.]DAK20507.1 MAG TPA: hypothetical protein [Caudoviricetes sp.]
MLPSFLLPSKIRQKLILKYDIFCNCFRKPQYKTLIITTYFEI